MALSIRPFEFGYQNNLRPTQNIDKPSWGPPDMSKQLQEGIAAVLPNLMKQYDDMYTRRQGEGVRQKMDKEAELARLQSQYGSPLSGGGGTTTLTGGTGPAPANPEGAARKIPTFAALPNQGVAESFQPLFDSKEQQYALPPGTLGSMAFLESRLNPKAKNPNSSAGGMFQFIDSTAKQYGLNDKFDVDQSTDAAARLAADNASILQKALGRQPTVGELYLAHQQGSGGALKLLSNPDARAADLVGAKAVRLNGGDPNMSGREFAGLWMNKADSVWQGMYGGRQRAPGPGGPQSPASPQNPAVAAPQAAITPAVQPGAPQAVAAAAPGVVPRSGPTEQAVSSAQNQPPLFSTPQLGTATGTPQNPRDVETTGATGPASQPMQMPPGTGGPGPVPPPVPGGPSMANAASPGNQLPLGMPGVGPQEPQPAPAAEAPPPAQAPPPVAAPPPAAAPGGGVPPQGPQTAAVTPPGQTVIPEYVAPQQPQQTQQPQTTGTTGSLPPQTQQALARVGVAPQAMAGLSPNMIEALGLALSSGDPGLIQGTVGAINTMTQARQAGSSGSADWSYERDPKTGRTVAFNKRTTEQREIDPGRKPGEADPNTDRIVQPGDPDYLKYAQEGDTRSWRLTTDDKGNVKPEPIQPGSNFEHETKLAEKIDANPQFKEYQAGSTGLKVLRSNFDEGSPEGDVSAVFTFMKGLDPGSAVREGEQASMREASGPFAGLWAQYNKLVGSGAFLPEQRQRFYNTAVSTVQARAPAAEAVVNEQRRRALANKLNPDNVSVWKPEKLERVGKTTKDPETGQEVETFRNKEGFNQDKGDGKGEIGRSESKPLVIDEAFKTEQEAAAYLKRAGKTHPGYYQVTIEGQGTTTLFAGQRER